jgi:hypothetical protein
MFTTITKTKLWISVVALLAAVMFLPQAAFAKPTLVPVTIDLCATTGTVSLPGAGSVTIWGYALGDCSGSPTASLPGPMLVVNEGDEVTVNLHNNLGEDTALLFQGQNLIPDLTGAAANGGTTSYLFTAVPGTYLYEAGLLPNAEHQVAMGMYGALVVQSATAGQAYSSPDSTFDAETVLVLSEIDPALNSRANPATFDMRNYAPRYRLINGQVYPNTAGITATAGEKLLVRYVNAGLEQHSMATLGLKQVVIAMDGSPLLYSHTVVAENIAPGQTADALVSIPLTTPDGSQFSLYDGNLLLRNSSLPGYGGMLTFLSVGSAGPGTDTTGPSTSGISLVPNPTNGAVSVVVMASVSDLASGGANVSAAEYYIDSTSGTANAMDASDGSFDSPSEAVQATISTATLAGLSSGSHTIYVRGQDDVGNWGSFNFAVLNLDKAGPATLNPTLTPNPSSGTVDVALHATGNDSASGGSNIAAAEYFIDTLGADGNGTPMTVNTTAPVASLDATIPAATVSALSDGAHTVYVHSQDSFDNWGPAGTIDLNKVSSGPITANVSAAPNPNNGTMPLDSTSPVVRVTAEFSSSGANLNAAEGFIDTVGADGSGFPFIATDGVFNSLSETGYGDIPLTTIALLSEGSHTIYVHARNTTGTWGATASTVLLIDKTAPTVSGTSAAPNPTEGAASVTLTATANDSVSGVTMAEWFTGADPGPGNGTAMTIGGTGPWGLSATLDVSTWADGSYIISVRAKDAVGTWSPVDTTVLVVSTPVVTPTGLFFSTLANGTIPGVSGPYDNADIYNWNGTAFSRVWDGTVNGLPGAADVDGMVIIDATHFYLSFSTDTTLPVLGTVQDEDVIYYNNGAWSVYFDGTGLGLTAGNQDLDAIDIIGGTLYFSTLGNTNPPGLGGTADDADIYSWNGTSFARVWDASAAGLAGTADVDGLSFVDAAHFYLSFNTTTALAGLGTVQGEDVVYYDNGTWSVYFDGTSQGLTTPQQQVDAIDVQ